jgi:hypothetical protein
MKKDEKYIKGLLSKVFEGVGTFQQFEFNYFGGSNRPDFVILNKDKFTYFEIKSELDSFVRLEKQLVESQGYFTEVFVVIPKSKLNKFLELKLDMGVYLVEDLEKGKKEPHFVPEYWKNRIWGRNLSIEKVSNVLWASDLRYYIKAKMPNMWCVDRWNGAKKSLSKMGVDELRKSFTLFYSDNDCLNILNEVLPNRNYNFRSYRIK